MNNRGDIHSIISFGFYVALMPLIVSRFYVVSHGFHTLSRDVQVVRMSFTGFPQFELVLRAVLMHAETGIVSVYITLTS